MHLRHDARQLEALRLLRLPPATFASARGVAADGEATGRQGAQWIRLCDAVWVRDEAQEARNARVHRLCCGVAERDVTDVELLLRLEAVLHRHVYRHAAEGAVHLAHIENGERLNGAACLLLSFLYLAGQQ
ncbi:hypothetical protein DQ04_08451020 [Trypanosoma grayi]|uniref:hypothetical protein n=1 Tax=Trypanosoma grayi TaxID=71804 RepID=UPI0004F496CE|nr:hypothetical protein DQ04_08451020 [Trypanosoma grayi]KEG07929.1 hypothetical protein DQ04_08451020 [Trypanosoma grayi]